VASNWSMLGNMCLVHCTSHAEAESILEERSLCIWSACVSIPLKCRRNSIACSMWTCPSTDTLSTLIASPMGHMLLSTSATNSLLQLCCSSAFVVTLLCVQEFLFKWILVGCTHALKFDALSSNDYYFWSEMARINGMKIIAKISLWIFHQHGS